MEGFIGTAITEERKAKAHRMSKIGSSEFEIVDPDLIDPDLITSDELTRDDWDDLATILQNLKPFRRLTLQLQGSGTQANHANPVWYTSWHTGILVCATSVIVVLLINVGLTVYATTNPGYEMERGIGTFVRNLFRIKPERALLWIAIGFTSIPLHFLYNSVVYNSLSANDFLVTVVTKDHFEPGAFSNLSMVSWFLPSLNATTGEGYRYLDDMELFKSMLEGHNASTHRYEDLTPSEAQEVEISGCKSERAAEKCKVQFSLGIMIAIICCNLVKACSMIMAVVRSREPTLVTLGDAVDSFLRAPDPTTMGICYADRRFIEEEWRRGWKTGPRYWKQKGVQRWWTSVSNVVYRETALYRDPARPWHE
ncbi:hypothetical protein B9Z19DRAFT_1127463 [Tuber borchii]|uniref:DUF6536 domain-containing protein n=1 Tax=Tuber borchii TaxID=42251 RepID=A0A2T6ZR91_TUBBO|nr:hypothetical protein B9Z19DRAFT_1127463 [Tuber borchii]